MSQVRVLPGEPDFLDSFCTALLAVVQAGPVLFLNALFAFSPTLSFLIGVTKFD